MRNPKEPVGIHSECQDSNTDLCEEAVVLIECLNIHRNKDGI